MKTKLGFCVLILFLFVLFGCATVHEASYFNGEVIIKSVEHEKNNPNEDYLIFQFCCSGEEYTIVFFEPDGENLEKWQVSPYIEKEVIANGDEMKLEKSHFDALIKITKNGISESHIIKVRRLNQ